VVQVLVSKYIAFQDQENGFASFHCREKTCKMDASLSLYMVVKVEQLPTGACSMIAGSFERSAHTSFRDAILQMVEIESYLPTCLPVAMTFLSIPTLNSMLSV
jgi:hypothetical protein